MAVMPRLADLRCSPMRFIPGDRILVRVFVELSDEQSRKLKRTVEKWAGKDVEVLIVNAKVCNITVDRSRDLKLP